MTAHELIQKLSQLPPETQVFMWVDGERYPIHADLDADYSEGCADINADLQPAATWQTQSRGTNWDEYQIYLACADNGKGGDITRNGAPLKTYDEWMKA